MKAYVYMNAEHSLCVRTDIGLLLGVAIGTFCTTRVKQLEAVAGLSFFVV